MIYLNHGATFILDDLVLFVPSSVSFPSLALRIVTAVALPIIAEIRICSFVWKMSEQMSFQIMLC